VTLFYFSPVPWDSYEQRPHYVVRDFLANGGSAVVWINPYAARLPNWRDATRADLRDAPMTLAQPAGLSVVDVGGLPIDPLPGGAAINRRLFWNRVIERLRAHGGGADAIIGIGRPTALALAALRSVRAVHSFYDAMDDFPEFYRGWSRDATRRIESEIVQRVDRVLVSSMHLREKFRAITAAVTLVRNAYDMSLLPPFTGALPDRPHIGFIGCLGGWFDWPLVLQLAESVQPMPVTLIGPQASPTPARRPSNIRMEPPCTQAEGVRRLQAFTIGLIPFKHNALTAGIDPIKYYQYRAAGLPILTTRFGEMAARTEADGTFALDGVDGVVQIVERAAAWRSTPEEVARFRADHSWSARFNNAGLWEPGGSAIIRR